MRGNANYRLGRGGRRQESYPMGQAYEYRAQRNSNYNTGPNYQHNFISNPFQYGIAKDNVDIETRRKIDNSRQLAIDHLAKLQTVVSRRYAFNDASLTDFYLQWRLATSIIAGLSGSNMPADRIIQSDTIQQYVRVFCQMVRIPFYAKSLNALDLRHLVLKTYYVSSEWLKALIIIVNSASSRLFKDTVFDMNEDGDNLLHIYVREGLYDKKMLELLSTVCGIDSANNKGETPLKLALLRDESSKKKFTTQLMEQGVDIGISLNSQLTTLPITTQPDHPQQQQQPIAPTTTPVDNSNSPSTSVSSSQLPSSVAAVDCTEDCLDNIEPDTGTPLASSIEHQTRITEDTTRNT